MVSETSSISLTPMVARATVQTSVRSRKRSRVPATGAVAFAFLVLVHATVVFGPLVVRTSSRDIDPAHVFAAPSPSHLLGTDEAGRDVLARLFEGGRLSLSVALAAMVIAVTAGTLIGGMSGYFGGGVDNILMRLADGMVALPTFFLLLVVTALFGGGPFILTFIIGLTAWMGVARVIRSEFLRWRSHDFVDAARCLGASHRRIMLRHLLPHAVPSLCVAATIGVSVAMLTESGLSYLGLGIVPPAASWGNLLMNAQKYLYRDPLLAVYPGVLILSVVLAYNFLGDGLREALDPKTAHRN